MNLDLNGVSVYAKQYVGIGVLRVDTTRGEVNCQSTDWILHFPDGVSCVLPDVTFCRLIQGDTHRAAIANKPIEESKVEEEESKVEELDEEGFPK